VCLSDPVPELRELHLELAPASRDLILLVGGGFVAGAGTRYLFDRFPFVEHLFLDVASVFCEERFDGAVDEMLRGFPCLRNVTIRYISSSSDHTMPPCIASRVRVAPHVFDMEYV
jgi:hypothetical protein